MANAAYVGIIGAAGTFGTRKVSAPTPWPKDSIPTWKLINNPAGDETIWYSDQGSISWKVPPEKPIRDLRANKIPEVVNDIRDKARKEVAQIARGLENIQARFAH